jgi:phosphonate transport system ATP-binding protein
MGTAIRVCHLSKRYRRALDTVCALDDVCLTIEAGEMVALIGASGSGKSSLVRQILGLSTGDCSDGPAEVSVLGEQVQAGGHVARGVRRIRARVAVVFQQFNLVGRLSLLTNVCLGVLGQIGIVRGTLGLFSRAEKRLAMEALHRVGLADRATQRASTLSGGEQQRGAIARALIQRAEIILADEPIASLDPESARRVMDTLAAINQEDGTTVVVSLHQIDFALRYCPRTVALRDGRVIYDGPSVALTPAFLREIYGTKSSELIFAGPLGAEPVTVPATPSPAIAGAL